MAIARKPKPTPAPDEREVQALIEKGGSVAAPPTSPTNGELTGILLRLPLEMVARIDAKVKERRPVRISRQSWMIEALQAYLAKDE